jgi:hypothetical protein
MRLLATTACVVCLLVLAAADPLRRAATEAEIDYAVVSL